MDSNGIAIAWIDLSFRVKQFWFSKEKTILNHLSGCAEFGTINALMGPSGAGKTTLLKCLNGNMSSGLDQNSKIFVNINEKINSCFVGQHSKEHLIMCLTAKQNLIYSSKLKNSDYKSNTGPIDHELNALEIMKELLIEEIAETRVDNCSGGEHKRLTIAIEMTKIVKPNILFIDEPTSGLDSIAAETVMQCLRRLSKSHLMSIITSIHQPNHEIVVMFDKIYVLSKSGNCLFSGTPKQIPSYLNECNIIMNENQVPIEQLLRLASIESYEESIDLLAKKTREEVKQLIVDDIKNQMKLTDNGLEFRSKSFKGIDMWYIMTRTVTQQFVSQWKTLLIQFLWYLLFPLFSSNAFNEDIGKASACIDQSMVTNTTCLKQLEDDYLIFQNLNFMYFMTLLVLFIHLCQSTLTYLTDLKIFVNEYQNKWYSTGSYFWAKNFVELMPTLLFSMMYAFLVFKLSGQYSEDHRDVQFVLVMMLGFICTEGIGHTIGILLINYHQIAVMLSLCLFLSLSLFANFFILIKDMPLLFQYMSEISFFKFLFSSILLIIYGQNRCSTEEKSYIMLKFGINDNQLCDNYIKLMTYALSLRIIPFLVLYLKNNLKFRVNSVRNKNQISDESIDLNSNYLTIPENGKGFLERDRQLIIDLNDTNGKTVENSEQSLKYRLSIAWNRLTLKIPKSFLNKEKLILDDICGYFHFSSINAVMGCSGAGKTSLLKCINGLNYEYLSDETTFLLNTNFIIKSCFITQEVKDHLLIGLTAGQAMTYASKLKNSDPVFDHKRNVEKLMDELLIRNTFDTNVENCSGGEQKRLVIAMELTSDFKPNLICIDEPTSGLDSTAAEVVIKCLKRLSENHNICVITSIHQPNNDILMLFDKIYVLSKAGQAIFGGRPQQLSKYLIDCDIECTESQLPIEVLLKHSCNTRVDTIIQRMIQKTEESEKSGIDRHVNEIKSVLEGIQMLSKRFLIRDLWLLLLRALTYTYRYYWRLIIIQFFAFICSALSMRQFFTKDIGRPNGCWSFADGIPDTCAKTKESIEEAVLMSYNLSYNFFILTNLLFLSITASTVSFTSDLKMFINEQRNGWYSTGTYYWSKTLVELIPTVATLICFAYVVDIYSEEQSMFCVYAIYMTVGALIAQSMGHFIGIIFSSNQRLAVFTSIGVQTVALFFSGFIIPIQEMHYSIQILSNLSPFRLIIEIIVVTQYGFDRCLKREFSVLLYMFQIENEDFYRNTQLLVLLFFLFRGLTLIILLIKVNSFIKSRKTEDSPLSGHKKTAESKPRKGDEFQKLYF